MPVLGNGDIWSAEDALGMVRADRLRRRRRRARLPGPAVAVRRPGGGLRRVAGSGCGPGCGEVDADDAPARRLPRRLLRRRQGPRPAATSASTSPGTSRASRPARPVRTPARPGRQRSQALDDLIAHPGPRRTVAGGGGRGSAWPGRLAGVVALPEDWLRWPSSTRRSVPRSPRPSCPSPAAERRPSSWMLALAGIN